jgi:uncharacterized DUF497 family protein
VEFEYDPNKSQLNKAKHGIDFEEAKGLWEAEKSVEYAAKSKTQTRMIRIAALKQKLWVCVFTLRGQKNQDNFGAASAPRRKETL